MMRFGKKTISWTRPYFFDFDDISLKNVEKNKNQKKKI